MNITRAKKLIRRYLAGGTPVFAWGAPGIGKSDIMREIAADDFDGNLVDFRAVLRDPVDLRGLPDIKGETARWLPPHELPQEKRDGKRGLLFLDELNAAPPAMQAACFGLVLDRKVGEYRLPDGWMVVAAGNRQSDRAAAQRMPTALANRFAHVDIEADAAAFAEWGAAHGIDPMVLAFIRFRPHLLHNMEGSDLRAFPSPRAWAQSAKYANELQSDRLDLISGIVGAGAAAEFEGFVRVYQDLPSLDLVLANPTTAPLVKEQSAKFAISYGLARKVDARTIAAGMTYIERLKAREFSIMFMVDAVRRDPGLSHTQVFVDWSVQNQDVTLAA